MATLTIQIVSIQGTSTKTLTFSPADAQRILAAYQNTTQQAATQDQLAIYLASYVQLFINRMVMQSETVAPTPPVMS